MHSLSPQANTFSENSILTFPKIKISPAARSANESESTLEGSTTTEVAVLSNRERGSGEDCGVAAAIHEHKLSVRLRRVRIHHAPKARVGALDDSARYLGSLGLLAHAVTWQDRNRLSSNLDRHLEFALTLAS